MATRDYSAEIEKEIEDTEISGLCEKWESKYRAIAVSIQALLTVLYPAGAKLMGLIIAYIDNACRVK